ncbi:MAG: hypothetical protein CME62_09630 [Halobacteriovoraceae bacterium]|nr:hypothetical protein [Halobacteriovoraceae bacterium]|tara:strand:- start:3408 stop:4166 length:759 start_codon:yes stop_codon:yes gene_type:complete
MFRIILCVLLSFSCFAENKAYEIAKKVEKANEGFKGETAEMEMILINGSNKITRTMTSKVLEVGEDETRTLLEFLLPLDVKGTKLLTWSYDEKDDSQWIYMPAFNKIKRISSSSVSSSFMGSEFTFEDLRTNSAEKYTYTFIKEEKSGDDLIWIYERKSKKKSGYSKQIVHVSQKYMNAIATKYFDRAGQLVKEATISDFKKMDYKGKTFFRAGKIEMVNQQTKKSSILNWKDRKIGVDLSTRAFSKKALKQ